MTVKKYPETRYFLSERLYLNKGKKFLSKLKTATYRKVNANDTLKINATQIYIYKFLSHNEIKVSDAFYPVKEDYILPEKRDPG